MTNTTLLILMGIILSDMRARYYGLSGEAAKEALANIEELKALIEVVKNEINNEV